MVVLGEVVPGKDTREPASVLVPCGPSPPAPPGAPWEPDRTATRHEANEKRDTEWQKDLSPAAPPRSQRRTGPAQVRGPNAPAEGPWADRNKGAAPCPDHRPPPKGPRTSGRRGRKGRRPQSPRQTTDVLRGRPFPREDAPVSGNPPRADAPVPGPLGDGVGGGRRARGPRPPEARRGAPLSGGLQGGWGPRGSLPSARPWVVSEARATDPP